MAELKKMLVCREIEKETEGPRRRKGKEAFSHIKAGVKWDLPAFLGLIPGPTETVLLS